MQKKTNIEGRYIISFKNNDLILLRKTSVTVANLFLNFIYRSIFRGENWIRKRKKYFANFEIKLS